MSDLPLTGLMQQAHARPKSGEELEVLGKTAAASWLEGRVSSLTDAVVETVKHAGLSPEQVKRVCEFANTDAFLKEFKKEGEASKVVDFDGGPADPSEVLKDLNDGGGGSVFDPGTLDYQSQPTEKKASASLREEAILAQSFGADPPMQYADPLGDVMDIRDKLAGAYEHLSAELSGCETAFGDLSNDLYYQVKQAYLEGATLGQISQVMAAGSPSDEFMKAAFSFMTPRLLSEGIFHNVQQAMASMDKTAMRATVNPQHPLVWAMSEFSSCLQKMAEIRVARDEVNAAQAEATDFLKQAAGGKEGVLLKALRASDTAAKHVAPKAGRAAEKLVGSLVHERAGQAAGKGVETAVKHAPKALVVGGALEAGRRAANNPYINKAFHTAQAHLNPLSDDWDYETYKQQGGQ